MYKKYLVIASKKDIAGMNITTNLAQFRASPLNSSFGEKPNFDFYFVEEEIIFTKNLNLEKINQYDFVIFVSRHQSEKKEKTLSIHAPGNFRGSEFGGEPGKVCKSSALFQKQLFEKLNEISTEYNLKKYKPTLECTHHGPLINKPCVFIEIGSTEVEWKDRKAGFIVAKTINETIKNFKDNPYNEIAIAIGGPHYCPNFNKIQLESNIAISHVISQYVFPLTEEMVKEALEKTQEEVDFVVLDWKGMGTAEQRQQALDILSKLYVSYKKTSDIQ